MENYEKLSVIGRGAHGTCYLSSRLDGKFGYKKDDINKGNYVVIKEIELDGRALNDNGNFQEEVNILRMLKHPNVIDYYDSFFCGDYKLCIVMQYVEGGSLAQFLATRKGRLLKEERVIYYLTQLVLALSYIHSKRIVHRDLKPSNILLNRAKTVCKLTDFGISRRLEGTEPLFATSVLGTLDYFAPEICQGGSTASYKSDVWALGCILYELITLRRPFHSDSFPETIGKIVRCNYEPLPPNTVSYEMRQLVENILDVSAGKRPEMKDILTSHLVFPVAMRFWCGLGIEMTTVSPSLKSALDTSRKLRTKPDNRLRKEIFSRNNQNWQKPITQWDDEGIGMDMSTEMTHL